MGWAGDEGSLVFCPGSRQQGRYAAVHEQHPWHGVEEQNVMALYCSACILARTRSLVCAAYLIAG